jgi:hypothetical protein
MENDQLPWVSLEPCDHSNQRQYTQRRFDILSGFELMETRCINCHKILITKITKFETDKTLFRGRMEKTTKITFPKWMIETLEVFRDNESPNLTLDEYLSNFYGKAVHVVTQE